MRSACTAGARSPDDAPRTRIGTSRRVLAELSGRQVYRAAEIPVYEFGRGFVEEVAAALQRRSDVTLSVIERQLYLDVGGQPFTAAVVQHHVM